MNKGWLLIPIALALSGCKDKNDTPSPEEKYKFSVSGSILIDGNLGKDISVLAGSNLVHSERSSVNGDFSVSFEVSEQDYKSMKSEPIIVRANLANNAEMSHFTNMTLASFTDSKLENIVLSPMSSAEYALADSNNSGQVNFKQWSEYHEYRDIDIANQTALKLATAQQHELLQSTKANVNDRDWLNSLKDNRNWNEWLENNQTDLMATWDSLFVGDMALEVERILNLQDGDTTLEDWHQSSDTILDAIESSCLISIIHSDGSDTGRGEVGDNWGLRSSIGDTSTGMPIDKAVSWISSNTSVIGINQHGEATLKSPGKATLSAQLNHDEQICFDSFDALVLEGGSDIELKDVKIVTLPEWLYVDESTDVKAVGVWSDGTMSQIDTLGEWSTSNEAIASFDQNRVAAHKAGTVSVNFTYQALSATAFLEVKVRADDAPSVDHIVIHGDTSAKPVGGSWELQARAMYNDGEHRDVTHMAYWGSSNPKVVTVTEGRVMALSSGYADIMALVDGISQQVRLVVTEVDEEAPEIVGMEIEGYEGPKLAGSSWLLDAMVEFDDGLILNLRSTAVWNSSDLNVATVRDGKVEALDEGVATISATFDGVEASIDVQVVLPDPELQSISVIGKVIPKPIGSAWNLTALAHYDNNTSYDYSSKVTWTSSNEAIASVSNGVVTALGAGTASITATYEGFDSRVTVSVNAPEPSSIDLDMASTDMEYGQTQTAKAYAVHTDGTRDDITEQVSWISSNPEVATVEGGKVYALTAGETTVSIRYFGFVAQEKLTVTEPIPERVVLDGNFDAMPRGINRQLRLLAYYDGDVEPKDITEVALWESSSANIISVDSGYITAVNIGEATIKAQWNSLTVQRAMVVRQADPVSVTPDITGNRLALKEGERVSSVIAIEYTDGTTTHFHEPRFTSVGSTTDESGLKILSLSNGNNSESIRGVRAGESTANLGQISDDMLQPLTQLGVIISGSGSYKRVDLDITVDDNLQEYKWTITRGNDIEGSIASTKFNFTQGDSVYQLVSVLPPVQGLLEYWLIEYNLEEGINYTLFWQGPRYGYTPIIDETSINGGGNGFFAYKLRKEDEDDYINYIYDFENDIHHEIEQDDRVTDRYGQIFSRGTIHHIDTNGDITLLTTFSDSSSNKRSLRTFKYSFKNRQWTIIEDVISTVYYSSNHRLWFAHARHDSYFIGMKVPSDTFYTNDHHIVLIDKKTGEKVQHNTHYGMLDENYCIDNGVSPVAYQISFIGDSNRYTMTCRATENTNQSKTDSHWLWATDSTWAKEVKFPQGFEQSLVNGSSVRFGDIYYTDLGRVESTDPTSKHNSNAISLTSIDDNTISYVLMDSVIENRVRLTNHLDNKSIDTQDMLLPNSNIDGEFAMILSDNRMVVKDTADNWLTDSELWGLPSTGNLWKVADTWVIVSNSGVFWTLRQRQPED
ncbi:hypothetical protein ST37_05940 [Vibrio sp. qd031]|uniref:Ig-like domain-containing protein n=1 Tax=Vibrio sp. qd031 TaxID=1603038 RepID=UPI000A11E862|nr:Ig-like domain-containing protein [Vibrio sp. qd031]ORT50937.1 hypothetical protein ST37_05940 [Vibrio sp. qd031]